MDLLHWWFDPGGAVGGFQVFEAPSFQKQWWSEDQIQNAKWKAVKCYDKKLSKSFSGTSKKVGPRFYLDFFTLDVEGAEYAISQLINFVVSKSKS